jgi:hypothetical protein
MSGGLTHGSQVALHRCMTCSTGSLTGASTFTNDEKLFDKCPAGLAVLPRTAAPKSGRSVANASDTYGSPAPCCI